MSFISTLLAFYNITLLKGGYQIGLDWLGQFARVIIEGVGVLGAGIIVFTLVLKAITLPFDIYQRVKMRKQNLVMKQMQPDLEKLQQQYANDKDMYNKKMMELYKKNGYSMLGACLPMIISLIILIVAFQGFRTYSQYANLKMYVNMSEQYTAAVLEHGVDGLNYRMPTDTETESENPNPVIDWVSDFSTKEEVAHEENGILYTYYTRITDAGTENEKTGHYLRVQSTDPEKYVFYFYSLDTVDNTRSYQVDSEKLKAVDGENFEQYLHPKDEEGNVTEISEELACKNYVRDIGANAAAEWYRENPPKFLWIKNVWYPDVSYNSPIQSYKKFSETVGNVKVTYPDGTKKALISELNQDNYELLTYKLEAEKSQANGYFILIILSIGLMVLSQWISMRSSKETNKYQTVDGSGARTQKMMLIIMPLIYAVFAFMYSAAFSIYMVISSAVSILVTLLSNLIIGAVFKKKEAALEQQRVTRKLPWMKDGVNYDKSKNSNKNDNKKEKNNDRGNGKRG